MFDGILFIRDIVHLWLEKPSTFLLIAQEMNHIFQEN
jgi:hypothetical protein